MTTAYHRLAERHARIAHLNNALGILHWDHATMMPEGSARARAEVMASLSGLAHELATAPDLGDWFAAAEGEALDDWQAANLREMRREWRAATCVPQDLVEAAIKAGSACEMVWRRARPDNDYASLVPSLQEVLDRKREIGQAKAEALGLSLYDALLDEYEPGGRAEAIDTLFASLEAFLPDFTEAVLAKQAVAPPIRVPDGPFPVDVQRQLGLELMERIGYDLDRGRLDISHHPFCGGAENDVRITTRYDEADFTRALMGVLHETGHALYEQGRPQGWLGQPVSRARGMSIHESQSLLIEMQVCRSREFLHFAAPIMARAFGGDGPDWGADALYRLYTRVTRGFIRVDADEVTYPAHVILRYRLERAMLASDLALRDLPGAWNELHQTLVGVTPPDDTVGCLQDFHWPSGAWGYFPTYTLGAMAAAQLFDAARAQDPDIPAGIARGDFEPLLGWLRAHVHGKGSLLESEDLLVAATGKPLDADLFKTHLRQRYLGEA